MDMPFGLRLSLLLLIAGCAEGTLVVPDSDWRNVPAAQRETIDRRHDAELASARTELATATASLAAFQRAPAPPRAAARAPATAPGDADEVAKLARDLERARTEALGRVNAATEDKQRTDLAWRQIRVDAAHAQIEMIVARRELTRAQAIDRNMPGNDSYDTAPLRGQFSRAQQRWYAISRSARTARDAFEHASADLASAKEAYAQLTRMGPIRLPEANDANDIAARFELPRWSIARSDIRRRRGLRHFIEETGATPQLRKVAIRLSPAPRFRPAPAAPPSVAAPAPPSVSPAAKDLSGEANRGNAAMADHPADRAGTATLPANKPAAPRSAAPVAIDHPADRAGKPERATAPTVPPAVASGKSAEPPRATPSLSTAASARSAEHAPPASASSAPGKSSAAPPGMSSGAATSAAKPVERPISESDPRAH
jgi:hypothetical protein